MICRWLSIGPYYSIAMVAAALIATPAGYAWLCRAVTVCHRCA